jgi:fructose-1,6-bisphosphatase/inositol monophosphatase family enzyme
VIDKVEALLREVAANAVLPRFGHLSADEITQKAPGDFVTTVDREAERQLTAGLTALLPDSTVVGEEAATVDTSLLARLAEPGNVWLVDPIDGTTNFVGGREPFAMMVALVRNGRTVASCILDPVTGVAAIAEAGSGAFLAGQRVWAPRTTRPANELQGFSTTRYTPAAVSTVIAESASTIGAVLPGHMCAGYEYPAIVRDEQQFVFFWRMLPWDHAPGILFVEEAGGVARHVDGRPYRPAGGGEGVLTAQNPDVWQTVRSTLLRGVSSGVPH